jgi:hypothetical protein
MMNMPRVQKSILSLRNVFVGGCMSRRVDTNHQRSCKLYVRIVDKLVQSLGVAELNPVSIYLRHVIRLAEDSTSSGRPCARQVLGRILLFHCKL